MEDRVDAILDSFDLLSALGEALGKDELNKLLDRSLRDLTVLTTIAKIDLVAIRQHGREGLLNACLKVGIGQGRAVIA